MKITKHELGVGWVKRSAPIRKMENGNDARIMRRQTYNETGFVETNLMGLLCVTHPTWNVMRFVLPACWGLLIDGCPTAGSGLQPEPSCLLNTDVCNNNVISKDINTGVQVANLNPQRILCELCVPHFHEGRHLR